MLQGDFGSGGGGGGGTWLEGKTTMQSRGLGGSHHTPSC